MTEAERESRELVVRARRLREIADSLYQQASSFDEQARHLVMRAQTEEESPSGGIEGDDSVSAC